MLAGSEMLFVVKLGGDSVMPVSWIGPVPEFVIVTVCPTLVEPSF